MARPQKHRAPTCGGDFHAHPGVTLDCASLEGFACWLTEWRFAHGFLSREGYDAAWRAHPEWRQV
jgi:hypothetical protein